MYVRNKEQPAESFDIIGFDPKSGSVLERILFNNRPIILWLSLILTAIFSFEATPVKFNASFDKMIPTKQPYIVNFFHHYDELQSQGNAIRIAVQADRGTIIDPVYLQNLKEINDRIYLLPNVDRQFMTSLWTSSTRWTAVISDGLANGPVIDGSYDGTPAELKIVARNIARTSRVGELVSNDYRSSMIYVPLLQFDGLTGKAINYGELANQLNQIRAQYARKGVTLHIMGFGMVVGDMINGIGKVIIFFGISVLVAICMLFWFTRCVRSVGIGVDYALYVLGIVMKQMRSGATLSEAYYRTLLFTGKVVLLTGCTLATGVVTWAFAPIKFQADMGVLLSFMFLWNMLGALVLLPSLAYFLLPPEIFRPEARAIPWDEENESCLPI